MRIAHLADAHLGFRQFQRLGEGGINQREADVAAAFRAAMDAVIARAPDVVLIAGDLFHSVRPTNRAIIEAFGQLARLRQALPAAPVVLIGGNHDTPRSAEVGSILKLVASLGVHVVDDATRRLAFPELRLTICAVPHAALLNGPRDWKPDPASRYNVLTMHPEVREIFGDHDHGDHGGARMAAVDLRAADWNYVALGHYHVVSKVAGNAWYSGSLEYTSPNIWSERREEDSRHVGKCWLLVDPDGGPPEQVRVPSQRHIHDLPRLDAAGMAAAELDLAIQGRVAGVAGGIAGTVTRLVVDNVPRPLAHMLDHGAIRDLRARALHFQLDLRRPERANRVIGMGAPGTRRTMPEVVAEYLGHRLIDADLDRDRLVALGRHYVEEVERAMAEGGA